VNDRPLSTGSPYLRRDGRAFLPVGAHVVPPEGPDWPWRTGAASFERAFARMAALGLDTARIDLLWAAVEPREGQYDEAHLAVLDEILAAAQRHGLLLHPALFIGGEVGDAYWDVPWRAGRHPHADPEMRRLQARHAAMLARRWRGHPALLGWDLTDEPPYWLFRDTSDEDARAWTRELAAAIRAEDPGTPVTVGTASQDVDGGPFRADVIAGELDFATVHPYPIFSPELYPDGLLGARMTHAAAFETTLAAGAGRSVMLHEYGASSAQFEPERIAAYDRLLAWSSLGRGANGFLAWCWTDAEPAACRRAPYVRGPHETQFGVTTWDGELRPRGRVLADLAASVRTLDLDGRAAFGPQPSAAIIVPHEYVRPYDPAGYGLSKAPSGPYEPAERAWTPERSVGPLVRGWLNGFVLAARAGFAVAFPRETLDGTWPDARLVLLPAPLVGATGTLHHVRTAFWDGARDHFARGRSAWAALSSDAAIPGAEGLLGIRLVDRAPAALPAVLQFVRPWGPFGIGDELVLPPGDGSLAERSALLAAAAGSEVIALDASGAPALVVARRGSGLAVTCSHPVELLLARQPDAHGPGDRSWGIYAGLAELATIADPASVADPDVTTGCLRGPAGGIVALTNHAPVSRHVRLVLPEDAADPVVHGSAGVVPAGPDRVIDLPAHGAALLSWGTR
jgi:hypothetical protein